MQISWDDWHWILSTVEIYPVMPRTLRWRRRRATEVIAQDACGADCVAHFYAVNGGYCGRLYVTNTTASGVPLRDAEALILSHKRQKP